MSGTGGWQTQVYDQPAAFLAGDRVSNNPLASFDAGPGGLVAGAGGITIGRFAWVYPPDDPNGTNMVVQNNGYGPVSGFVMRNQQGLNPTYLSNAGMTIQPGYEMALQVAGDFAVVNAGTLVPIPGQSKAFANLADGTVQFAAPGTVIGGASATGSTVTAETFSVTGSIADDVLTVTVVGSGTVYPGSTISGTGIAANTMVVSQLTGTAGGVGTYLVNLGQQTVASTTVSGTYGLLTIGTATGTFAVGDIISGTNVVAGTAITANVSGSGGSGGTMVVNNNTAVSSTTITASVAVETKWYAMSSGPNGAVVKISSWPVG